MDTSFSPRALLDHREFAVRLARRLLRDPDAAEDVAQEVLLASLQRPPHHEGVRAWIARVVRHRAGDRRRAETRRERRERGAARPEGHDDVASPTEILETQHVVVQAVLDLAEPYRTVVLATYYEGLKPEEIARRSGVPAGTVRSQLHRAHATLRDALERRHGAEDWRGALGAFLAATSGGATDGGAAALDASSRPASTRAGAQAVPAGATTTTTWVVVGSAAALLAAGALWYAERDTASAPELARLSASSASAPAGPADSARPSASARESAITPTAPDPAAAAAAEIDRLDPPALLDRARRLRAALLERRLGLDAADFDRRLASRDDAGVVKLIDRSISHEAWNHPGARGSGAYYSFTERVHDYDRRPQITFEDGELHAHQTSTEAWILDVGAVDPFTILANPIQSPFPADPALTITWETMTGPLFASMKGDRNWDMLSTDRQDRFERAHAAHTVTDTDLARAPTRASLERARPVVGHTYLLRSVEHGHFDIAVLIQVARVESDACTIRWLRLPGYPSDRPLDPSTLDASRAEVGPVPASWSAITNADLEAQLERVLARAETLLMTRFSPETEARYGVLRGRDGTGLARCFPYFSPWGELTRDPAAGHSHVSFAHGGHLASTHDLRLGESRKVLECAGYEGRVVDLGTLALEKVTPETLSGADADGLAFVRDFDFEARALALATAQAAKRGQPTPTPPLGPHDEAWIDACREFRRHLWDVFGVNDPLAQVGHTYLVRSFTPGASDVLAAFTVAESDAYGIVIAWRTLRAGAPAHPR